MSPPLAAPRFRAVTFDCYGTLVDWETGITQAVGVLLAARGERRPLAEILESFARHEARLEAQTPILAYRTLLRAALSAVGGDLGVQFDDRETHAFADSLGSWPLFSDVLPALRELRTRTVLGIISNVDWHSFRMTQPSLGGTVDLFCLAEDSGAYKPAARAFELMLARLSERGIGRKEVLHVAQSLFHDHEPAARLGIATCWLDRRHDKPGWGAVRPPQGEVRTDYRITSLDALGPLLSSGTTG
jgi:2-haloacid dehalogenase